MKSNIQDINPTNPSYEDKKENNIFTQYEKQNNNKNSSINDNISIDNNSNTNNNIYKITNSNIINNTNNNINKIPNSNINSNSNNNINNNINSNINSNSNSNNNINSNIKINAFQPQNINQIILNGEELVNNLTEEEIIKAKENSFILLGKTGVGKTSLLNVIYGKDVGKVGYSMLSETNESKFYCIKEKIKDKFLYFCIIDTPGLCDVGGKEIDEKQKKELMKVLSNEKLKIKGLLFLSNFQSERFDASEQATLMDYNKIFPLKDFWKRMIFIFTHYYGDPNGFSKEEIRQNNNLYKSEILQKLMLRVKSVSEPIQFDKLNFKYVNIYTRNLNELKVKNNLEIRKEIISEITNYIKLKPMFSKLQIFNFENYELEKDDKYLYTCDLYIYLDANDRVIHQDFHIINRVLKNKDLDTHIEPKVHLNIEDCQIDEKGNLIKRTTKKEGLEEIFINYKGKIGRGITILSLIGTVCSVFFPPALFVTLPSILGGEYLVNQDKLEKEQNKKRTEEIMVKENILSLIKNELKKYENIK